MGIGSSQSRNYRNVRVGAAVSYDDIEDAYAVQRITVHENRPEETWADTGSEWVRLADNLGFNAHNRHLDMYKLFENHVAKITNGNYSRIRSPQHLDEEGKGLLQLILDDERMVNPQEVHVQIDDDNQREIIPLTVNQQDEAENNAPEAKEIEETEEDEKKCRICTCCCGK